MKTIFDYSKQELSSISAYVMPDIPEAKADIAMIFGTRHGVEEFCQATYSLWQRNMFPKLIVSGGYTGGESAAEADVIANRLVELGIPQEVILLETAATNTGENVIFSRQKIADALGGNGVNSINSILVIGKVCSMRRYLMTIERHWPGLKKFACPVNYFGVDKDGWFEHEEFRNRVLNEFEKIPKYLQNDFIRELPDIP